MRINRSRRLPSLDFEHMKTLHEECAEQVDLMISTMDAALAAEGAAKDTLDEIIWSHWNQYIEIIHLIAMHDQQFHNAISALGLQRADEESDDKQYQKKRVFSRALLMNLLRRHRRMIHICNHMEAPGRDYLSESAFTERQNMTAVIEILHFIL